MGEPGGADALLGVRPQRRHRARHARPPRALVRRRVRASYTVAGEPSNVKSRERRLHRFRTAVGHHTYGTMHRTRVLRTRGEPNRIKKTTHAREPALVCRPLLKRYYADVPKGCSGAIKFFDPRAAPLDNPVCWHQLSFSFSFSSVCVYFHDVYGLFRTP